jgi:hypothetical protein
VAEDDVAVEVIGIEQNAISATINTMGLTRNIFFLNQWQGIIVVHLKQSMSSESDISAFLAVESREWFYDYDAPRNTSLIPSFATKYFTLHMATKVWSVATKFCFNRTTVPP